MNAIPIPRRLKNRPLFRGLPIPFITMTGDDGQPDFRVTDEYKRRTVMKNHWCQLCGEQLGRYIFFVGGTEAANANQYFEPACHLDCLVYAMQVCPFIVGRIEHADVEKVKAQRPDWDVRADATFSTVRNPYWIIKKATGYDYRKTSDGTILMAPQGVVASTTPIHAESMTPDEWDRITKELMK
jgi:hypothetical protein